MIGSASTVAAQDFNIAAKHAIAVEANTGKILYEKDATPTSWNRFNHKIDYGLSCTMKPLENGSITLSTPVDISDYP